MSVPSSNPARPSDASAIIAGLAAGSAAATAELQRLLLLQSMGIELYHPRFVLPAALPSQAGVWPQPADAVHVTDTPEVTMPAAAVEPATTPAAAPRGPERVAEITRARSIDIEPGSRPDPERTSAPRSKGNSESSESSRRNAAPEPAFQVLLIQADKGLAICNQLPLTARAALGRGELQLLQNLLAWLGCAVLPGAVQRHFAWPLPNVPAGDPQLAGRSLQSFLLQASQETGFTRLLLLGGSSVDCLQALPQGNVPWRAWSTHSLSELLALPSLKREAWLALQSLHAELR